MYKVYNVSVRYSTKTHERKKKMKKKIVLVVLMILVIGIIFVMCGNDGTENTETGGTETTASETSNDAKSDTTSALGIYQRLGEASEDSSLAYTVPDDAAKFIKDYPEFFPGSDDNVGAMSDHVNFDVTYRHLAKSISKYTGELVSVYGNVIDIEETPVDEGLTITSLQIDTEEGDFMVYYLGALDDVFEGSSISAYVLPFSMVTFENMANQYTEAVIGAVAYVDTLE